MLSDCPLAVENTSVTYGAGGVKSQALRNVSLGFTPGTLTLIMGPSGSGKTTLLSLLGCLLKPREGRVVVGGTDVTALSEAARTSVRKNKIGFVFQAFRLFHSLNAEQNIAVAAEISGSLSKRQRLERARALLSEFGISAKAGLTPDALSGGEKQRVAIARAIVKDPPILLADEPTASLDSRAGEQISEILHGLAEKKQKTVVVVSHDPRWEAHAHRTVVLRDGQIVEDRNSRHE